MESLYVIKIGGNIVDNPALLTACLNAFAFIEGTLLISMSPFNFKVIGFITPVGGLFLIASWFLLFVCFLRKNQ